MNTIYKQSSHKISQVKCWHVRRKGENTTITTTRFHHCYHRGSKEMTKPKTVCSRRSCSLGFQFLQLHQWWHIGPCLVWALITPQSPQQASAHIGTSSRPFFLHWAARCNHAVQPEHTGMDCLLADGCRVYLPLFPLRSPGPQSVKSFYIRTATLLIVGWQFPGKKTIHVSSYTVTGVRRIHVVELCPGPWNHLGHGRLYSHVQWLTYSYLVMAAWAYLKLLLLSLLHATLQTSSLIKWSQKQWW